MVQRIYMPKPLCLQLICNHHDHPTAGHFGHHKTIDLICCLYHWLGLTQVVKQYIWSCMVCAHSKADQHKLYGFLKQLPIPLHPWESISMDFIKQLLTSEGHMAILVIVNHLTKQSLFIPTHDSIDSLELAQLFLTHVFSKHGMPSHVTSNWGSEFVSHFFQSLGKLLQMELHFTSGYHPEGDGVDGEVVITVLLILNPPQLKNCGVGLRERLSCVYLILPMTRHNSDDESSDKNLKRSYPPYLSGRQLPWLVVLQLWPILES